MPSHIALTVLTDIRGAVAGAVVVLIAIALLKYRASR